MEMETHLERNSMELITQDNRFQVGTRVKKKRVGEAVKGRRRIKEMFVEGESLVGKVAMGIAAE